MTSFIEIIVECIYVFMFLCSKNNANEVVNQQKLQNKKCQRKIQFSLMYFKGKITHFFHKKHDHYSM